MIINIFTAIAGCMIKYNFESEYILWSIGIKLNNGSGKADIPQLFYEYSRFFDVSYKTFKRILDRGNKILWTKQKDLVFFISMKNWINRYSPVSIFSNKVLFDLNFCKLNDIKPKTLLCSVFVSADGKNKPVSMKLFSKQLNISRSTLQRNISDLIVERGTTVIDNYKGWNTFKLITGQFDDFSLAQKYISDFVYYKQTKYYMTKVNSDNYWETRVIC